MLKQIENTPNDIFGMKMAGEIEKEDYEMLDRAMEGYRENRENMKLLVLAKDFDWDGFKAVWADLEMGFKYLKDIKKTAVVTNINWMKNSSEAIDTLTPGMKMKTFSLEEEKEAINWLEKPSGQ